MDLKLYVNNLHSSLLFLGGNFILTPDKQEESSVDVIWARIDYSCDCVCSSAAKSACAARFGCYSDLCSEDLVRGKLHQERHVTIALQGTTDDQLQDQSAVSQKILQI